MAKAIAKKTVTREAYETALQGYVRMSNEVAALSVKRDKDVLALNKRYDPAFKEYMEQMGADFEVVAQYCEDNRDVLFPGGKSMEVFGAHIGYREGAEKVIVLEGFEEKVIAAKWVKLKAWVQYLRITPALDKKAIVKAKPKGLEKHGLKVGREECFFVEPIKTEVPA